MRIGVDLDGVLNDIAEWHFACGSKFCLEQNINRGFNPKGYYMEEQFHLTSEENIEFWRQYIFDLLIAIPIRPYASEVIHKLRKDGHKIIILSARDNQYLTHQYSGMIDYYVKAWLNKYNVEYDELVINTSNKREKCLSIGLDIMIEDKASNVDDISKIIPVMVFDAPYNQDCTGKNVIRVYSWYQIYQEIINKFAAVEII